jgi:hypothetical protein
MRSLFGLGIRLLAITSIAHAIYWLPMAIMGDSHVGATYCANVIAFAFVGVVLLSCATRIPQWLKVPEETVDVKTIPVDGLAHTALLLYAIYLLIDALPSLIHWSYVFAIEGSLPKNQRWVEGQLIDNLVQMVLAIIIVLSSRRLARVMCGDESRTT